MCLIQIEIADWFSGVGGFFGFFYGFLKFFLEQFGGVFLGLDGLAEDGVAAAILLFHGAGGFFHVLKSSRLDGRGMRDYGLRLRIDLQDCSAAGAGHIKIGLTFRHTRMIPQSRSARREFEGQNVEEVKHFPSEQDDGDDYDQDRQELAEVEAGAVGVETARSEAEDVESGESENERPENVVDLIAGGDKQESGGENSDGERMEQARCSGK